MTPKSISLSLSNGLGGLEFSDAGRQFMLCSACMLPWARDAAPAAGAAAQAPAGTPIRFEWHGNGERLVALLRHADVRRLRSLVSREEPFVLRMSDAQVRTAAAGLLRRGRLAMFETGADATPLMQAPRPAAALPIAVTVPRPPPPAPRTSAVPVSTPSPPPAPFESGLAPGADQDAQAAVLVVAAKNGIAFCEECLKRARQREAENDEVLA